MRNSCEASWPTFKLLTFHELDRSFSEYRIMCLCRLRVLTEAISHRLIAYKSPRVETRGRSRPWRILFCSCGVRASMRSCLLVRVELCSRSMGLVFSLIEDPTFFSSTMAAILIDGRQTNTKNKILSKWDLKMISTRIAAWACQFMSEKGCLGDLGKVAFP